MNGFWAIVLFIGYTAASSTPNSEISRSTASQSLVEMNYFFAVSLALCLVWVVYNFHGYYLYDEPGEENRHAYQGEPTINQENMINKSASVFSGCTITGKSTITFNNPVNVYPHQPSDHQGIQRDHRQSSAPTQSGHSQSSAPTNSDGIQSFAPAQPDGSQSIAPAQSGGSQSSVPAQSGGSQSIAPAQSGGSQSSVPAQSGHSQSSAPVQPGHSQPNSASVHPAGRSQPNRASVHPAGRSQPNRASAQPAGCSQPNKASAQPAGHSQLNRASAHPGHNQPYSAYAQPGHSQPNSASAQPGHSQLDRTSAQPAGHIQLNRASAQPAYPDHSQPHLPSNNYAEETSEPVSASKLHHENNKDRRLIPEREQFISGCKPFLPPHDARVKNFDNCTRNSEDTDSYTVDRSLDYRYTATNATALVNGQNVVPDVTTNAGNRQADMLYGLTDAQ